MHSRLYHSVVSNCQVDHNHYLLQYSLDLWIFCTYMTEHYLIYIKHQIWIQMIESSIVIHHLNMIWTMYCGNAVKCSFCDYVRRFSDGKSLIFISTISCWLFTLKRHSEQNAQAAILACDWSRLLNVSWHSIASSCPMGLPIKFEMQFHMTDPSTFIIEYCHTRICWTTIKISRCQCWILVKYTLVGEQIRGWYSILEARYRKEYIALVAKYFYVILQFCLVNVRSLAVYFANAPSQCFWEGEIRQAQGRNWKPKNGFEYMYFDDLQIQ